MNKQKNYIDEIAKEFETISEILERHYNNADVIGDLALGDLEADLELNRNQAHQNEKERIIEIIKSVMKDWECVTEIDNPVSIEDLTKDIIKKIKELK